MLLQQCSFHVRIGPFRTPNCCVVLVLGLYAAGTSRVFGGEGLSPKTSISMEDTEGSRLTTHHLCVVMRLPSDQATMNMTRHVLSVA